MLKTTAEIKKAFPWLKESDLQGLNYPGWNNIFFWFCEQFEQLGFVRTMSKRTVKFPHVKEKLGQLHVGSIYYPNVVTGYQLEKYSKIAKFAELEGKHTCYLCGAPDAFIVNKGGLLICLCNTHQEDFKRNYRTGKLDM